MNFSRRDFLKTSGILSFGFTFTPQILFAQNNQRFSDFKALVVFNMMGGNDALNTFIPGDKSKTGEYRDYDTYASLRNSETRINAKDYMGDLKKYIDSEGNVAFGNIEDAPYYDSSKSTAVSCKKGFYLHQKSGFDGKIATNILMPEFAAWVEKGYVAVIQNVGNISGPWTKSELLNEPQKVPPFIFAHDHQSNLMQMGKASTTAGTTGWLGRLEDKWRLNQNSVYDMNINLSPFGTNKMMFGKTSLGMDYSNTGPKSIDMSYYDENLEYLFGQRRVDNMFGNLFIKKRKSVYG